MLIGAILLTFLHVINRYRGGQHDRFLTVKKQVADASLYYTGIIEPINTTVVTSPADGIVANMPFQYGSYVNAHDSLFMLSSAKFLSDYQLALMQFVKAKNDFNNGETELKEAEFLHKKLLISDDEYRSKQSSYYAARLALLQARDNLSVYLQQLHAEDKNLYQLTIADADKIIQTLHSQMNSQAIQITAPISGILLGPTKNNDETKKTMKGDFVKQGDLLAVIGDMSGLSIKIMVNEIVINQLYVGQPVKVTGLAFRDMSLAGMIRYVDHQAEAGSNGLPMFLVNVVVPHLTAEQQKYIHVGMSANVMIEQHDDAGIHIPIAAVIQKNGIAYVKMLDARRCEQLVPIKTGATSQNTVTVLAGIKEGDRIIYAD